MKKRVGLYAWGGPETIQLLKTKYHSPRIDEESFVTLYELEYLQRAQELFGVTDAWVTYSWGFSDAREQDGYSFLREKLPNFQQLGIKTHAYVQGLNLATADFLDQDLFCRDPWGRLIPYSKGRSFTCPNNPNVVSLITNRVERACQEDVDGIFVDNILFGLPPFAVYSDFLPFFGCACIHCQEQFRTQFGYALPLFEKRGQEVSDYLEFRASSIQKIIERLSRIVHAHHKEFGINLSDPTLRLDTLYYGYKFDTIEPFLDYLLIENHSLPDWKSRSNAHLHKIIQSTQKPVFVVSYKHGIGSEPHYTQVDIDRIFSESKHLGYSVCLKATEFTTNGVWHTLNLSALRAPRFSNKMYSHTLKFPTIQKSTSLSRYITRISQRSVLSLLQAVHHNRQLASIVSRSGIYSRQIQKPRAITL
jgi:hypothetical protein